MEKDALAHFILNIRPIDRLTLTHILAAFSACQLKKQSYLLETGGMSNEYLFLTKGIMRAFTYNYDGDEVTTGLYGPNNMVIEVSSFFTRTASLETIQALTDCEGYTLSFEQMNNLFHTIPDFREFGRAMLVRGFAAFKQRTLAMITQTAEERYVALLSASPELIQHVPVKYIASYLGITDTSLSRIRRELAKKR